MDSKKPNAKPSDAMCEHCQRPRKDVLLREPEMLRRTGHKRATARDHMNRRSPRFDPKFPQPVPLAENSRAVGFVEAEVDDYIAGRIAARNASLQLSRNGESQ